MIDPYAKAAYSGVYQAYAWHQGYVDQPVIFRVPDEYFYIPTDHKPDHTKPQAENEFFSPFSIRDFMAVVAEMDNEGFIHLWRYSEAEGDRFLELSCTEGNHEIPAVAIHSSNPKWAELS